MNYKEQRPWGEFENLLDNDYVKLNKLLLNQDKHQVINIILKERSLGYCPR
jgi:hypothetical protein